MKQIILYSFIFVVIGTINAQDPNFSQFYNNPVYYNPGMVAMNNGYSLKAHARNLWAPIPGKFNTFSASFEAQVIPKLGFAVNAYTDVAGEANLRTTGGYMTYAYRPVDNRNFMLQVGVTGGVVNKSIDWSKLRFSDHYHEVHGEVGTTQFMAPNYNNVVYADFGSGIVMRFNHQSKKRGMYKKMMTTIGFSALHLTQPNEGLIVGDNLPMKFVGSFSSAILLNETIITPSIIYERQNTFQTATIGFSVIKRPLVFGVWLRNEGLFYRPHRFDSFVFNLGVHIPGQKEQVLKIMYSIDFTLSPLRRSSFGSHEISIIYDWDDRYIFQKYRAKKSKMRRYQCPKGFLGV